MRIEALPGAVRERGGGGSVFARTPQYGTFSRFTLVRLLIVGSRWRWRGSGEARYGGGHESRRDSFYRSVRRFLSMEGKEHMAISAPGPSW